MYQPLECTESCGRSLNAGVAFCNPLLLTNSGCLLGNWLFFNLLFSDSYQRVKDYGNRNTPNFKMRSKFENTIACVNVFKASDPYYEINP